MPKSSCSSIFRPLPEIEGRLGACTQLAHDGDANAAAVAGRAFSILLAIIIWVFRSTVPVDPLDLALGWPKAAGALRWR